MDFVAGRRPALRQGRAEGSAFPPATLSEGRLPTFWWGQEVADPPQGSPGVPEELRVITADGGSLGVLAAVDNRRAEDQRALEGSHLLEDRLGRDVVGTDRVEPLGERHRLGEADQHPRVGNEIRLAD